MSTGGVSEPPASTSAAAETERTEKRTCKLLLVGPPCAGKSSLLQAYNGADFDAYEIYRPTTSSDFSVKDVRVCDVEICLQVWDVGGNSMGRSFLRGSNAVVLVVDLTNRSSMDGLDALYERVRNFSGFPDDNFPCVLLGNKADIVIGSKREVTFDMLLKWAQQRRTNGGNKIHCFEASAKTKTGVMEAFAKACEVFLRKPVSPGAPTFVPTTSSVVDGAESATSGRRRGIVNRSYVNTTGSSIDDEEIPIAKIVLAGIAAYIPLHCFLDKITHYVSDKPISLHIIAGPPNAGKTCMLTRFVSTDTEIPARHEPTIGADFRVSEVQVNDITLTLQIWDTAGDKKMLSIGKSLYKNADGIILVYDITSRASFKSLDVYWDNFLKYSGMDEAEFFPAVLVGNKSDLSDKREVSLEEVSLSRHYSV